MLRILIVDDEYPTHESIRCMLNWEALGYENPESAMNGEEALKKQRANPYHVMLVDIQMPGMSGLSLVKAVHCISHETQIVIISGYSNFSYAQEALRSGVRDYFLKPLDRHEVQDCMERLAAEFHQKEGTSEAKVPQERTVKPVMERVIEYVDSCFRSEIRVAELAHTFYMSPPYLGQQFRKVTGMTINDYIARKRIDWVKQELQSKDGHIQETIHQAGYADCAYFYRKFQQMEGISFLEWKKTIK